MDKEQNTVKKGELYESLRSERLGTLLLTAIFACCGIGVVVLAIIGEIKLSRWYDFLVVILMGGFGAVMLILFVSILKEMFTPQKSTLFERFGDAENISRIISIMNETKVYEDYNIIISQDYIMEKDVYGSLLNLDEVRWIYICTNKVNYVTTTYSLVLHDRYGQVEYKYERRELPIIEKIISILENRCPAAKIDYHSLPNMTPGK